MCRLKAQQCALKSGTVQSQNIAVAEVWFIRATAAGGAGVLKPQVESAYYFSKVCAEGCKRERTTISNCGL